MIIVYKVLVSILYLIYASLMLAGRVLLIAPAIMFWLFIFAAGHIGLNETLDGLKDISAVRSIVFISIILTTGCMMVFSRIVPKTPNFITELKEIIDHHERNA